MRQYQPYHFDPVPHEANLVGIVGALDALPEVTDRAINKILRQFPKGGGKTYSKSELILGVRHFAEQYGWDPLQFARALRRKPIRTLSGVTPVTVLTRPHPCPGQCIFCPSDARMPKSYLSQEPGAQRAAQNKFDPYAQTWTRLLSFHRNGHAIDKIELIILGGTWSFYPEDYQIWFIKRCFDAMNDFDARSDELVDPEDWVLDYEHQPLVVEASKEGPNYNLVVLQDLKKRWQGRDLNEHENAKWLELEEAHRKNEDAYARCVGLVVETRPDYLDAKEVDRIRRLGATKIQMGIQSTSDEILEANKRGHDVDSTRKAAHLMRAAGFKFHGHWMANLYKATPETDIVDFMGVFDDPALKPDELKVYPCSLIESAELMHHYNAGTWHPYTADDLDQVLSAVILDTPKYCRLTRIIRDIPAHDIVVGNTMSNFRELVEKGLKEKGTGSTDIRAREIRGQIVDRDSLIFRARNYRTTVGWQYFLELSTEEERIAAFLRLSLPDEDCVEESMFAEELKGCAMIREVHVYGSVASLSDGPTGNAQHLGLGKRLVKEAEARARAAGFKRLAVISAIGTRNYYRKLGFEDGKLYQAKDL